MRRALLALALISGVGAVVGGFVVHKGLAFSGDALAHSTLAGVAVAFASGGNGGLGALAAAAVTALGIGWTRERARVSYDTAIGITFVAMFAFGILVISRRTSYTPDLFSFVFGNILGVSRADLAGAALLAVLLLLFVAATYREQLLVTYDPAMASAAGGGGRPSPHARPPRIRGGGGRGGPGACCSGPPASCSRRPRRTRGGGARRAPPSTSGGAPSPFAPLLRRP